MTLDQLALSILLDGTLSNSEREAQLAALAKIGVKLVKTNDRRPPQRQS